MTYLKASQEGYLLSENTQLGYFKEAQRAYEQALKDINKEISDTYKNYLAGVDKDQFYNTMLKYDRLGKLKKSITELYKKYSTLAGKQIKTGLIEGATENYFRSLYLSMFSGTDIKPIPIDEKIVEYMCTGNVEVWKEIQKDTYTKLYGDLRNYAPQAGTLTDLLSKNYANELDSILRTMESGLIRGVPYREMAKSIKEIIGSAVMTADDLTGKGATYKALRIARTEGNRVLNASSLAEMEVLKSQGLDIKKQWLATLDGRTRASHGALDGKQANVNENFPNGPMAPGQWGIASEDINCRCDMVTVQEGLEPTMRTARDPVTGKSVPIDWTTYNEWIKQFN